MRGVNSHSMSYKPETALVKTSMVPDFQLPSPLLTKTGNGLKIILAFQKCDQIKSNRLFLISTHGTFYNREKSSNGSLVNAIIFKWVSISSSFIW